MGDEERMQLVILGMHRSGTSLLTRIINLMGAYVGAEGTLVGFNQENPKGFWERKDVRTIDQDLLKTIEADWYKVAYFDLNKLTENDQAAFEQKARMIVLNLDAHRPWVLKDPRICLLLPLWRPLLEAPICIHIYRSPLQVAQSLRTRNGFPIHFGVALWEKYTLAALENSRNLPRLFVSHHRLLEQPLETVRVLYEQLLTLGVQGLRLPSEREILAFLDPALHHERGDAGLKKEFINFSQEALFQALEEAAVGDFDDLPSLSAGAQEALERHEIEERRERQRAALEQSKTTEVTTLQQRLAEAEQTRVTEVQALQQQKTEAERALATAYERLLALVQSKAAEGQALQQKLAGAEQALAVANERLLTFDQKVSEGQALQQKLIETERQLADRQQQLSVRTTEVHQYVQDSAQLSRWIGLFDRCFVSVINSKRWQLGHALAAFFRKIRFKPPLPMPQESWESIMKEFTAWKKAKEARNKTGQLPSKPVSGPSAAVLPAVALQGGKGSLAQPATMTALAPERNREKERPR